MEDIKIGSANHCVGLMAFFHASLLPLTDEEDENGKPFVSLSTMRRYAENSNGGEERLYTRLFKSYAEKRTIWTPLIEFRGAR